MARGRFPFRDLTHKRFGRLVVIGFAGRKHELKAHRAAKDEAEVFLYGLVRPRETTAIVGAAWQWLEAGRCRAMSLRVLLEPIRLGGCCARELFLASRVLKNVDY